MAQEGAPDLMHALVEAFAPEPAPFASSDEAMVKNGALSAPIFFPR